MVTFEELVEQLSKPEAYDEEVDDVKVIHTAISTVFLTGDFVYKLLKPVDLGFCDFSTFEKRKKDCKKIIEKNKPISPELYVGVLPVTLENNNVKINGSGKTIDYVVKMRELPQEEIMSDLLDEGEVNETHIRKLAREVSKMHKKIKSDDETKRNSSLDTILYNWKESFEQTDEYRGTLVNNYDYYKIKYSVLSFISENTDLFEKRVNKGFAKDCHGDLHSGNIFIHQDKPIIFDGVEFNNRISQSDTASDVAFLLMDLEFNNKKELSDVFLKEYLNNTEDYGMLQVLPFYKCYRACVRAKINSMISKDNNVPEEKQEAAKSLAKKYYDLAKKYSDNLKLKPKLFIFTGLQGSGKSFCAKSLEKVLGIERIVTDKVRRKLYNLPESGPIPESKKPEVFSEEGIDRGYTELFNVAESELKGGNSCILDATFDRLKRREKAYTLANKHNAESMLIYCSAPDEVCIRRTSKKRRFSTAGPDTFEKYKGNFDFPTPEENPITIDCSRDGENIPKLMEPIIKYKMEGVKNE